jgi:hypothetical protein
MCPVQTVTYVSGCSSAGYRVLSQKPQPTIQPTLYCTICVPNPYQMRFHVCRLATRFVITALRKFVPSIGSAKST